MAAKKTSLRAVSADEKAPRIPPKGVREAADRGTPRELFVELRDRIATAVDDKNTPARELASLTKRLVEVVRDIEAIDARALQEGAENAEVPDEALDASSF